ncbi:hypothetical protein ORJ00_14790 [Rheinheimera baltica]|uniref:hypothetical protein n=1 Tax=Rheinheimera baltica TaxID=67576 RepID=UPI00273FAB78|nr:hypothetical protein [Rheinheimera baltica]MDP5144013.1 hypothetical protein [Rheinheimera baltica]MDP5151565.1 hypothetical protein [Rheinheimera baltica]
MRLGLSLLLLLSVPALGAVQFSQAECQALNTERLDIRKQLRQPYTAEQGEQLQARQKKLLQLLKHHCKKPVKAPPANELPRLP